MYTCKNCNNQQESGMRFCCACGTPVTEDSPVAEPEVAPANEVCQEKETADESTVAIYSEPVAEAETASEPIVEAEPVAEASNEAEGVAVAEPVAEAQPEPVAEPISDVQPEPKAVAQPKPEKPKKKKGRGTLIAVISIVLVVALLGVSAAFVIPLLGGGNGGSADYTDPKNDYAFYFKGSDIYFTDFDGDPIKITKRIFDSEDVFEENPSAASSLLSYCRYSASTNTVFYPDKLGNYSDFFDSDNYSNCVNLYYKDLDSVNEDDSGVAQKIDSNVTSYMYNEKDNTVVYLTVDDTLYLYDVAAEEKEKLGSDVNYCTYNEDFTKLFYYTNDRSIYFIANGEKNKLASEVEDLFWPESFAVLYYVKNGSLYKQPVEVDAEREKLANDVESIVFADSKGNVYYTTVTTETKTLYDYVNDDLLASDNNPNIVMPEEPVEPDVIKPTKPTPQYSYSDYYWGDCTYEEYQQSQIDYEAALQDYQAELDEYDAIYAEYEQALYEYEQEYRLYLEAFEEIEARNDLRDELKANTDTNSIHSLHYHDGENSKMIEKSIYGSYFDEYSDNTAIYRAIIEGETEKINMSEIDSVYDVESFMYGFEPETQKKFVSAGVTQDIQLENIYDTFFSEDGKTLYVTTKQFPVDFYIELKKLYKCEITEKGLGKAELVTDEVIYAYDINNNLIYYSDVSDLGDDYYTEQGDLYINGKKIDSDVVTTRSAVYCEHTQAFIYATDISTKSNLYTLKIFDGEDTKKISDDVCYNEYLPSGNVVYMFDYSDNTHTGELYYFNGNEKVKIDEDVLYFRTQMYAETFQYIY